MRKDKIILISIHSDLPALLSLVALENSINQFIHLSALESKMQLTVNTLLVNLTVRKGLKKFSKSVILKPSIVYSIDDNFTTNFMRLLSILPVMPLYYSVQNKIYTILYLI